MRIHTINNLTTFESNQEITFRNKLTLLFGYNGSGKTSISRLLNYASSSRFENFDFTNLRALGSVEDLSYKLVKDDETTTEKMKIIVFNKDYIESKIEQNSFVDNSINSDDVKVADITFPKKSEYEKMKKEVDDLSIHIKEVDTQISDRLTKVLYDEKKKIDAVRLSTYSVEKFVLEYSTIKSKYDVSLGTELVARLEAYKSINDESKINDIVMLQDNILDAIGEALQFDEAKIKVDLFDKLLRDEKDWVLEGLDYVKDDLCPFCQNNIKDNQFVDQYKKYKDSRMSAKISQLKSLSQAFKSHIENIESSLKVLRNDLINYKVVIEDSSEIESNLIDLGRKLADLKNHVEEKVLKKCEDNYEIISISELKSLVDEIKLLSTNISKYIIRQTTRFSKVKDQIRTTKAEYLEKIVYPIMKSNVETLYKDLQASKDKEKTLRSGFDIVSREYLDELKSKNPVIKCVNSIFEQLSFDKYFVNENFSLVHKGSSKAIDDSYAEKLSDGEKSLVAFALFYSEIKLGLFEDIELLVIDDPVSSLDYENIYNIYYLIDDLMKSTKETKFLICTHNHIYLNCLVYSHRDAQLYRIDKDDNGRSKVVIDSNRSNNIYMDKLRQIFDISKQPAILPNQRAMIPNFCRYILETLAIFLFPNCNDSLDMLEAKINELNQRRTEQGEPRLLNPSRLNSLISTVQIGSHATVDKVLEGEREPDSQYLKMCRDTITIVSLYANEQLSFKQ